MTEPQSAASRVRISLRSSVLLRLCLIGVMMALLLVPLAMIGSLVVERRQRSAEARNKIMASWGPEQVVGGPLLTVPYEIEDNGMLVGELVLLPDNLDVHGRIEPETRYVGIFESVVYRVHLEISGVFSPAAGETLLGVAPRALRWSETRLALPLSDLRGVRSAVSLTWAGETVPMRPGSASVVGLDRGIEASLPAPWPAGSPRVGFSLELDLAGTGSLHFVPVGGDTSVRLESPWESPGFVGAFLPAERAVDDGGFAALWQLTAIGRGFPSSWRSDTVTQENLAGAMHQARFGVELVQPVDVYRQSMRSIKYSALFLVAAFTTFFLFEVLHPVTLHPLHYLLVGFALCVFYLLLLSISEHLEFGRAYAVSTAATVLLIGGYSTSVLRSRRRGAAMTAGLAALYSYLYVLLRAEDFALLLGSMALFVLLSIVMFLTRRLDWSASEQPRGDGGPG